MQADPGSKGTAVGLLRSQRTRRRQAFFFTSLMLEKVMPSARSLV
jgi:hypothetical protein